MALRTPNKKYIGLAAFAAAVIILSAANEYHHYRQDKTLSVVPQTHAQNLESPPKTQSPAPLETPAVEIPKDRILTVPILMYHHIGIAPPTADATHKSLTVSPADFEQQVQWLYQNGYQSISLEDLNLYAAGKFALPKKPVIFTFDDGYEDVFTNAVPILKQYGYSGAFGIITQFVGQTQGDNFYASWSEIKTAAALQMEIVCHTQNHFDGTNPKFDAAYIYNNLSGCQQDLRSHLADVEPILIYPYGHYNAQYLEQAGKAGFILGVTTREGKIINLGDLMQIPRIRIHSQENFEKFKKLVSE